VFALEDAVYFLKGEEEICSALYSAGWIQDYILVSHDDSKIIWTELGEAKIKDFLTEIEGIYHIGSDKERRGVRAFATYHGIIKSTTRDHIYSWTFGELDKAPLRIIACDSFGNMEEFWSDPSKVEQAIDFIEQADARGQEVALVLKQGYLFPRGAKGYIKGRVAHL
jgi:hypothetical protein